MPALPAVTDMGTPLSLYPSIPGQTAAALPQPQQQQSAPRAAPGQQGSGGGLQHSMQQPAHMPRAAAAAQQAAWWSEQQAQQPPEAPLVTSGERTASAAHAPQRAYLQALLQQQERRARDLLELEEARMMERNLAAQVHQKHQQIMLLEASVASRLAGPEHARQLTDASTQQQQQLCQAWNEQRRALNSRLLNLNHTGAICQQYHLIALLEATDVCSRSVEHAQQLADAVSLQQELCHALNQHR